MFGNFNTLKGDANDLSGSNNQVDGSDNVLKSNGSGNKDSQKKVNDLVAQLDERMASMNSGNFENFGNFGKDVVLKGFSSNG